MRKMVNTSQRPLGITIIAVLIGIGAILGICSGVVGLGFAPASLFGQGGGFGAMFSTGLSAIITLVLAVISLAVAWGLWTLQPWAFWATVIVEVLTLINIGAGMMQGA